MLVALTQVLGMPSRLVFAGMRIKKGHVVAEVFVGGKWALDAGRKAAVSKEIWDKYVAWMDRPLDLFWQVGYCNYFIH